jgi:hypothetical protein
LASLGKLQAQAIPVPNGSFESPTPPPGFPVTTLIDVWQKSAQPPGVPLPGGITWDQLSGAFPNTPVGSPDHIDNLDGNQAAYKVVSDRRDCVITAEARVERFLFLPANIFAVCYRSVHRGLCSYRQTYCGQQTES